jgi:hypothetical protein
MVFHHHDILIVHVCLLLLVLLLFYNYQPILGKAETKEKKEKVNKKIKMKATAERKETK